MPKRNPHLYDKNQTKKITTNLFELKYNDFFHNLTLFKIETNPDLSENNFILRRKIYNYIETNFPKNFRHFYPLKPSISHSLLNFSHNEEKTKLILSPRINDSFINIKDYSSPKNTLSAMRQSSAQYRINYNKYSKIRNKIYSI